MNELMFKTIGEKRQFVVPDWYNHDTYLAEFAKKAPKLGFAMHPDVNAVNYPQASTRLTPGAQFSVQVIGIHSGTTIRVSECVKFLIAEGASLTGPHGLLYAYEAIRDIFLPGHAYVSHDVKEMAHRDKENKIRFPSISIPPSANHKPGLNHPRSREHGRNTRLLLMKLSRA